MGRELTLNRIELRHQGHESQVATRDRRSVSDRSVLVLCGIR